MTTVRHSAFVILHFLVLLLVAAGGCKPAGVIFPPLANPPRWPPPPEPARITYVGELTTDRDLKAAEPLFQGLGQALFGKPPVHAMLTPYAVCTDGDRLVFVADSNAQLVHVFDLGSRRYARWVPGGDRRFSQPVGIAWDAVGRRLLVSDSVAGVVHAFDAKGKHLGELGAGILRRPCGLVVHRASGRIYVADATAHQVVVMSGDGRELVRIGRRGNQPGQFNYPTAVALDGRNRLYVCDSLNFRVQQIGPDFKTIRSVGQQGDLPGYFARPKAIAVDSEDHLYVLDAAFEAVQIFDAEGRLLLDFGQEGRQPGQFWLPSGLWIDGANRIWVADSYNRRIQVFDYLPEHKP